MSGVAGKTADLIVHEEVAFPSYDGKATCRGDLWIPPVEPKGVVQLVHGMTEHLGRYEEFAIALCHAGFAACGIDHLGHGRTTIDATSRGVYDPKSGATSLIEDQHTLRGIIQERFADVPYFVLGHSMGSFVARCYISRYGEGLAGALLVGTGWHEPAAIVGIRGVTRAAARIRGWNFRSRVIDKIGVGDYNKKFEDDDTDTGFEWLSRDTDRVTSYDADPDCGWMFSISGYYALFTLLGEACSKKAIAKTPANLPIFIFSGSEDPVGGEGVGPARVFRAYKEAGIEDVEFDLVEGGRHEILGETNRDEVFAEIIDWLEDHLNS